ncbi:MAG: lysophospholipid acyltransferase family protein [Deferrisomatales bacterium]
MRVSIGHRLEYAAMRSLQAAAGALPWGGRVALGRGVGRLWHRVDRRHRALALDNVARAFPVWPPEHVAATVRANFEHLGFTAAVFLGLAAAPPEELVERCRIEGLEHLDAARDQGRGVLLLTGHLGNWELTGTTLAALGYPTCAVVRRLKNPLVDRWVTALREGFGGRVIHHRDAVRPILRALREGAAVGFLVDQKALAREAVESRFFGRPVATNQGLALLALRTGAPVVPGFDQRVGDRHVMRAEPALVPPAEGTLEERVRRFTREFDAVTEAAVRRCPEQWFWVHRRWRLPGEWTA